ncbi:Uncharacterised protein [Candidatus Anstonella stagnisolia]|nr:Uncharacterised protein [Candidatus Anstonella stagnisolia]
MVSGSFVSQFNFFKLREGAVWFESLPAISAKATKSATNLCGTYQIVYPNAKGIALNYFTHFDNQELWFAHIPTKTMYRVMAGQINALSPDKANRLTIDGRGLLGLFTDKKVNQSWSSKRGDFILCDPTFGAIPTNFPMVSTWNGFTDDYDRLDYWNATRWGSQPAWCDIIDGELEVTGIGAGTRTQMGLTSYNYEVIEFRAKVGAASNNVKFGFSDVARAEYVQFSLNAANVTCENKTGGVGTSTATVDAVTQTAYNYYRIEWDNGQARFFVNGVLEVTTLVNVPAGLLFPFFEMASTAQVLTLDYIKVITLTKKFDSYVASDKIFTDVVTDICDVGNTITSFSFLIDDDWDFHAFMLNAKPSGYSYGYNSSLYNGKYQTIISLDLNEEAKDLYNYVRVTGGEKLITVAAPNWTDQFIGNGTDTSFALGYKAKKPLTLLQVDGVTKTEDTDFTVAYGKDTSVVKFGTAPANTKTVNIRYDYYLPIIATSQNFASIARYGVTRQYDKSDDTITSDDRARNFAAALLAYFSDPRFVIKVTIPLDPRIQVGTTVAIDAPYYGITNTVYQIIEAEWEMGLGVWTTKLTLENTEINTSAEIIREILQQLKDLKTRGDTNATVTEEYKIEDDIAFNGLLEVEPNYICDSFIAEHPLNGLLGRGTTLDDMEGSVTGRWIGTNCTLTADAVTFIVGAQSLKLTSSASPFNIASTTSLGDLSAYTGAASGTPASGTCGIWVYAAADNAITSATLRIGSTSSNYTEVAGVKAYTINNGSAAGFTCNTGWNYFVFRLVNGATTGTPVWTSVAYARVSFVSAGTPVIYCDYFSIGSGNVIAQNGLGSRVETGVYTTLTTDSII